MTLHYEDGGLRLFHGKNLDVLGADALGYPFDLGYHPDRLIPDESYDSIVTDPPYELGFMGKGWDSSGIAYDVDVWRECFRVLKPGGYLMSFGGTRTWHRIATAIEDAGFEIRDSIAWMYGSGFPKSMDVAKAIDKAARGVPQGGADPTSANHGQYRTSKTEGSRWSGDSGQGFGAGGSRFLADGAASGSDTEPAASGSAEIVTESAREWEGWGTALKPAFEPIIVARKPLVGTVAANVLAYGTGAINIDATRIATDEDRRRNAAGGQNGLNGERTFRIRERRAEDVPETSGRFPSNVLLDESQAAALDEQTGILTSGANPTRRGSDKTRNAYGEFKGQADITPARGANSGGASRFFPTFRYEAKAPGWERPEVDGVAHATVKPLDLMRWLVRLVTRPGGRVLDLYAGSGTTGEAALLEGFEVDLIELEADHLPLILARVRKPLQPSMFGDWDAA